MVEKHRILIVDDTVANIKVLNDLLRDQYNVTVATNGSDALELAESENKPDLILLDVMMPEIDGFEVAVILKKNKKTSDIPIIFVTANKDIESTVKGFNIGGNDYITKPIQPEELIVRVKTHLELYEARKKLAVLNQDLTSAVDKKTAQIREQNNRLLALNEQLTIEKEKALASDRLKTEFLQQISHEIRTPLNNIIGTSQLLGSDCESMDESEREEMIEGIQEGSDRLTRTIELIMEVAKIKSGNYQSKSETIDMNMLIGKMTEVYQSEAEQKSLNLILEPFPEQVMINADRYSVTKIIDHILDNAIKFTPSGSVRIECKQFDNDKWAISFEDTGVGMSPEYQKELFNPFSQEDCGMSRTYDGNGLGLALVKHCCELNNAEILVESTKESGSVFTVIFKTLN